MKVGFEELTGTITYKIGEKGDIDPDLDKLLEKAMESIGAKRWASGKDLRTGVRDLGFIFPEKK